MLPSPVSSRTVALSATASVQTTLRSIAWPAADALGRVPVDGVGQHPNLGCFTDQSTNQAQLVEQGRLERGADAESHPALDPPALGRAAPTVRAADSTTGFADQRLSSAIS